MYVFGGRKLSTNGTKPRLLMLITNANGSVSETASHRMTDIVTGRYVANGIGRALSFMAKPG